MKALTKKLAATMALCLGMSMVLSPVSHAAGESALPTEETESVTFTVTNSVYMGSTVVISILAEPKNENVALVMEAAPKEDSAYTDALQHGDDIWGVDLEAYVEGADQTWQSLQTERLGSGLLQHLVVALGPADLPDTLDVNVHCKVFTPDNPDEAAESVPISLDLAHSLSDTVSFDTDVVIGRYCLEQIRVDGTYIGPRIALSGTSVNEKIPDISYVKADGVILTGGSGESTLDGDTGKCIVDRIYEGSIDSPQMLEISIDNTILEVDLAAKTAQVK